VCDTANFGDLGRRFGPKQQSRPSLIEAAILDEKRGEIGLVDHGVLLAHDGREPGDEFRRQ
jgi:hypothetical protein